MQGSDHGRVRGKVSVILHIILDTTPREIRLYDNNSLRLTKYDDGLDKTIIRLMFSGISGNISCIAIKLLIT